MEFFELCVLIGRNGQNHQNKMLMPFKTRQQLADEFGISVRTLYRWLTKRNVKLPGGLVRPADQDAIYQMLGKTGDDRPPSENGKDAGSGSSGLESHRKKRRNDRDSP